MQLTPRQALLQFAHVLHAHVLQLELFPCLEAAAGPLTPPLQLLASVVSLVPLHRLLDAGRARTGRPARNRVALATAFVAKAIQFCGWRSAAAVPHESKFSRAFAEFAAGQLPQQRHAALIEATQRPRLVGHIARDSTAIPAREHFPETVRQAKRAAQKSKSKRPKGSFAKAKAGERGTRLEQQRNQKLPALLAGLPQQCDIGAKKDSQGHEHYWRGYKLHLDIADGQLPISAVLTSASVHDSQVAIPRMTLTSQRVDYLYELMDSAYDADHIHQHSRQLDHVPIIAPHPRRGTKRPSPLTKVFPAQATPELTWAQRDRFKERTMVERVNARLKDEFGASHLRVRGAAKVMAHLMFGVLALTVDQWLRMVCIT